MNDWPGPISPGRHLPALRHRRQQWWIADLSILDAASGLMSHLQTRASRINFRRGRLNGKSSQFIEGLMSDFGSVGGDIFLMPATGERRKISPPERNASASWLPWTKVENCRRRYTRRANPPISLDPSTSKIDSLYRAEDLVSNGTWGLLSPFRMTAKFPQLFVARFRITGNWAAHRD